MSTLQVGELTIPPDIHTLEGFRAWVRTLDEPAPQVSFVRGHVFVEMSQNDRTHAPVATTINAALTRLAEEQGVGMYCTPPSWFTCVDAELSTEPDGFFVRHDTLQRGDMHLHPKRDNEMVGRPDFVLEVASRSSKRKDCKLLPAAYAKAGVAEYWLVEVGKGDDLSFRTLLLQEEAYVDAPVDAVGVVRPSQAARRPRGDDRPSVKRLGVCPARPARVLLRRTTDGWRESPTWGRSSCLRRLVNPAGLPEFRLDVRPA